MRFSEDIFETF